MEEIINNIMHNPENTNPNVLRDQLQGISSGVGVVIVDEVTLENGAEILNINAGELYNLSKNNIVFCKQIISTPDFNVENYTLLGGSSYQPISLETGPEMGYYFEFGSAMFRGFIDTYPYSMDGPAPWDSDVVA